MSFFSSIVDFGKSVWNSVSGSGLGRSIVSTLLTGYALNQVTKSINPGNANTSANISQIEQKESGNQLQLAPANDNKIPVVYGKATIGGAITDAKMSTDNQKMTFVVTLCEVTGTILSSSLASEFTFNDVYVNGNRVIFKNDGITASYTISPDGVIDRSVDGLIKVYCYKDGSSTPAIIDNYSAGASSPAYSIMPGWTSSHTMNKLVFAIVEITYNRAKNVTSLPSMTFALENTLSQPGDCLYDYMTSTRYGAGIDPAEIYSV
jgi:hypothetical protein